MVTVALVIAAANASTTGDDTYVDAVGDAAEDDGGANEYELARDRNVLTGRVPRCACGRGACAAPA